MLQFFKNGCIAYNCRFAKLLHVDVLCILWMVFCAGAKDSYTDNKVKVARMQWFDDTLVCIVAALLLSVFVCKPVCTIVIAICACFVQPLLYFAIATASRIVAYLKDQYDDCYWASHYRLDMLDCMYNSSKHTFMRHWTFIKFALTPGKKYKKQGWHIKVLK